MVRPALRLKILSGPVITISIEPEIDFNDRSGMSSSTRARAIELWQTDIPEGDSNAKIKQALSISHMPVTAEEGFKKTLGSF